MEDLCHETETIAFSQIRSMTPITVHPKQKGQSKEETDCMRLIGH